MNLDIYIEHIHPIFDESIICLKQMLFWYKGSTEIFYSTSESINDVREREHRPCS